MTVRDLLDRVSSRELSEWMAYFQFEHLGIAPEERADLRMGILAATSVNAQRGKGSRAAKPADFMPQFTSDRQGQSWQELQAGMLALAKQREPKPKPPAAEAPSDALETPRHARHGRVGIREGRQKG